MVLHMYNKKQNKRFNDKWKNKNVQFHAILFYARN